MEEDPRREKYNKVRKGIMVLIKNKNFIVGAGLIYLGISLSVMGLDKFLETFFSEEVLNKILQFSPVILIVLGIGLSMFNYLEGNKTTTSSESSIINKNDSKLNFELKRSIEEIVLNQKKNQNQTNDIILRLEKLFDNQNELQLDKNQKEELFKSLTESFAENVNDDFFEKLNENVSTQLTNEKKSRLNFLFNDFESIKMRLGGEIEKLSRKANVNLVIGSLTTIVALVTLSFLVFQNNLKLTNMTEILYHYLPRISLIIFIEVFAYFFLRLYKLNLNDMKYFQNELTTVELKLASITTAINFGKDIDISAITLELAQTERNFIIKKGEVSISKENKNNQIDVKDLIKIFTETINSSKK